MVDGASARRGANDASPANVANRATARTAPRSRACATNAAHDVRTRNSGTGERGDREGNAQRANGHARGRSVARATKAPARLGGRVAHGSHPGNPLRPRVPSAGSPADELSHKTGGIEVLSWSFGPSNPTVTAGGGVVRRASRPDFQGFTVTTAFDGTTHRFQRDWASLKYLDATSLLLDQPASVPSYVIAVQITFTHLRAVSCAATSVGAHGARAASRRGASCCGRCARRARRTPSFAASSPRRRTRCRHRS